MDVYYTVNCDQADAVISVSFSGYNADTDETVPISRKNITGDGFEDDKPLALGKEMHAVWNAGADLPKNYCCEQFAVNVTASCGKPYLVVDLSGGSTASSYPYWYTDEAPDTTSDTCRTTELWLRIIPAGTFTMGSPTSETGRSSDETQHEVTLTQDYYIGVFECTQKQYELVMGSKPSKYSGDTRPVEEVSYNTIRGTGSSAGAGWPAYAHTVDSSSFMGKLQAKTGLVFDLPTEAQWEYACRKKADGTCWTTALNSGKNVTTTGSGSDTNMNEVGRYSGNTSDGKGGYSANHTKVGSYLPSELGLYDMHGNVWEWCLDWYDTYPTTEQADYAGPASGARRVLRGGSWHRYAQYCRAAYRGNDDPSGPYDGVKNYNYGYGFRIACGAQPGANGSTSGGETSGGETSGGETSGGETSGGETSGGETSGGKTTGGETTGGETSGGETSGGETSGGENTLDFATATYLVVDLSGGSTATSYLARYTNEAPDITSDVCRTTELWLRRIPAGTFTMGAGSNENTNISMTISKDFYIGVFECTQAQYKNIMGTNPSGYSGDTRPVESVSYDIIRGTGTTAGAGWPTYGHIVDSSSFMGKLQAKTGLTFDLPTDTQWEAACRKRADGTYWGTDFNSGKSLTDDTTCPNMAEVGRYSGNTSDDKGGYSANHTKVGSYLPSELGLYDMHGNVWEWCLDWGASLPTTAQTDYGGPTTGSVRMIRGGSCANGAWNCRAANRVGGESSASSGNGPGDGCLGFRIVCVEK